MPGDPETIAPFIEHVARLKSYFHRHSLHQPLFIPEFTASEAILGVMEKGSMPVEEKLSAIVTLYNQVKEGDHYNGTGWFDFQLALQNYFIHYGWTFVIDQESGLAEMKAVLMQEPISTHPSPDNSVRRNGLLGTYLFVFLLFAASGTASICLYIRFFHSFGPVMPGVFYTGCTLLLFVELDVPLVRRKLLVYAGGMLALYVIILLLTWATSFFAYAGGIVTSALGAWLSFVLTRRTIIPLRFNRNTVLWMGGLSFAIVDILVLSFNWLTGELPMQYLFGYEEAIPLLFCEILLVWQVVMGMTLCKTVLQHTYGRYV